MTLTEFLLARIADDEAAARGVVGTPDRSWGCDPIRLERGATFALMPHGSNLAVTPDRVLAECEARREAIRLAWSDTLQIEGEWGMGHGQARLEQDNDYPGVVQALALPYADHPDYQQEWAL